MNIEINSGQIIDPVNGTSEVQSLYISEGKIASKGTPPVGFVADQVIDASGCVVSPGFIDLCAHLREPGYEYKGTIATETLAAVRGGFTAVCCPPDSLPVNDSEAVTHLILDLSRRANLAKVYPIGALTKGLKGQQLSEIYSLKKAGCVGVGNSGEPVKDLSVMKRCLEYAKTHNVSVFVRPVDAALAADGCVHEGATATRLGLNGIPSLAETVAVSQLVLLSEETGAHLHLSQLTAAKSVALVADAKKRGVSITADVSAQHLLLTDISVCGFESQLHTLPPFRTEADRIALIEGVKSGVIDAICSQHQPHEAAAKQAPFAESEPGISSIETVLPLMLQLEREALLPLDVIIRALSAGAAGVLGVTGGSLAEGSSADVCIFDPAKKWLVTDDTLKSLGKSTPWKGKELQGAVINTLVDGKLVYA